MTKGMMRLMGQLCGLGLLVLMLTLAAGCGGNQDIETDPTRDTTTPTEVVPETPVPEDTGATDVVPAQDFSVMDPSDYGIEDVFFDFDVYQLSDEAMATLASNATIMRGKAGVTWLVEGHCDERGTVEYNLALGEKRAIAVRDYLVSLGVSRGVLRITSYGEERPFAAGHNEASWAQNRRSHFARP